MCSRRDSISDFAFFFSEKIILDISCESSAGQTIHMKCQALFTVENKKNIEMASAVVVGSWPFKNATKQKKMSHRTTKPTTRPVSPANTQISLSVHPVWQSSRLSLCG